MGYKFRAHRKYPLTTTQSPGAAQASLGLIYIKGLTKRYRSVAVLQSFTLALETGHIVGLMGLNGCGKTTLLKIFAGILSDYEGSTAIDGHHPDPVSRSIISYLPDVDFFNPEWNACTAVTEYSRFSTNFDADRVVAMVDFYGLPTTRPLSNVSKSMGEKLRIALIMARQARVYPLDEPISGVNPATRDAMFEGILREFNVSLPLIMSTYLISDIEHFIDYVLPMEKSRVFPRAAPTARGPRGETLST